MNAAGNNDNMRKVENRLRTVILGMLIALSLCGMAVRAFAQQDAAANYKGKCASCHGDDGSGRTAVSRKVNVPDLRSKEIRSMPDDNLYEAIAEGTKPREYPHAFLCKGLKESEIADIVQYMRAMK
ncbi:MAG TPA: c-type cytochrome [Candidatus Acidoferrum sp.]|nr:c-type cytochrome [Candidatus Acidoferrum sp.]